MKFGMAMAAMIRTTATTTSSSSSENTFAVGLRTGDSPDLFWPRMILTSHLRDRRDSLEPPSFCKTGEDGIASSPLGPTRLGPNFTCLDGTNLGPGTLRSSTSNTIFLLFFWMARITYNTLCFSNIEELLAPKSHWDSNCNFQESPTNDSLCHSA